MLKSAAEQFAEEDDKRHHPDTRKKVDMVLVSNNNDSNKYDNKLPIEISNLPESVQKAVCELPINIINRLLSISKSSQEKHESLEAILAKLDEESRERMLKSWLQDMFLNCNMGDVFREDTKNTMLRFLACIWNNRGKQEGDVELFNNGYYENFENERIEMTNEIKRIKNKIEELKKIMEKVRKKKRETEKKQEIMQGLRIELEEKQKELELFDRENQNLDIDRWKGKSVRQRHELEKKLTKSVATAAEFFDPMELAILIAETIESSVFSSEKRVLQTGKWFGKTVDKSVVDKCKGYIDTIEDAITQWSEENKNSPIFRKKEQTGTLKRVDLIIDYFRTLLESYKTDPENRIYELIQMENVAAFLKRMAGEIK